MKKNYVQHIIIHRQEDTFPNTLSEKIAAFHAEIVERRLKQSTLTTSQKLAVIDQIMVNLRSQGIGTILK